MNQFDRVFTLHREFSNRRHGISFDALQGELGWTRTTLRRTLDFLRDQLHAPLLNDREHGWRYDHDQRYELPGLWFTAAELSALLVLQEIIDQHPVGLLSEALKPARARLEHLLQQTGAGLPDWRHRLRLLRIAARPAGTQFDIVAEALIRRHRLRLDYHARSDDRMAPRIVSPQRLTLYRENWYLDAWCHRRNDLRIFAVDRIIAAEAVEQPAIDVPEDQLSRTLATSYGIFAGQPTATAVLRFTAQAARWIAGETWHPEQQDSAEEDESLTRRLPYHRSEELVMDVLRHGPDVEVLAPESLRNEVIDRLSRTLAQYSSTPPLQAFPPSPAGEGRDGSSRPNVNLPRKRSKLGPAGGLSGG